MCSVCRESGPAPSGPCSVNLCRKRKVTSLTKTHNFKSDVPPPFPLWEGRGEILLFLVSLRIWPRTAAKTLFRARRPHLRRESRSNTGALWGVFALTGAEPHGTPYPIRM